MSDTQSTLTASSIANIGHNSINELQLRCESLGKDLHSALDHEREIYASNKSASEKIDVLKEENKDLRRRRATWEEEAGKWRNKAGELEAMIIERRKENDFLGQKITDLTNALSSRTVPCEPFTEINFNIQSGMPNREDKQTIRYSTKNGYAARLMHSINALLKSTDAKRVIDFIEGIANLH